MRSGILRPMRTDELDYELPEELIAQTPADRRDAARLMVVDPTIDQVDHRVVRDLPEMLRPGDLLVINDTKVLPARFRAVRLDTGGKVDGLFLETRDDRTWHIMIQCRGKPVVGERLGIVTPDESSADQFPHQLELLHREPAGSWLARRHSELNTEQLLEAVGSMPLPPYIQRRRDEGGGAFAALDRRRYQTVYARRPGAVAAPTAGLHFTDELLCELEAAGVEIVRLTLHVGLGTFQPVRAETLEAHEMHREWFSVPGETLTALRRARNEGRRIIPVGTTSVRTLESLPEPLPDVPVGEAYTAETGLLIQPGFAFRYCDGLMTNFHLPRSTLIALVAAVTGLERLQALYQLAIDRRYRFYSYGDAMLILGKR